MRAARATACGIVVGCFVWAAASALGVAAVLGSSATVYASFKLLAGAYLILLGSRALRAAASSRRPAEIEPEVSALKALRSPVAFRQGLTTNLLKRKIAVLYATLLPQFLVRGDPVIALSLLMAAIHGVIGMLWLSLYARLVVAAGSVLRRPRVRAGIEALTGAVLVYLGLRLAAEGRR